MVYQTVGFFFAGMRGLTGQAEQAGKAGHLGIDHAARGSFPKIEAGEGSVGKALFGQVGEPLLEKSDALSHAFRAFLPALGLSGFTHWRLGGVCYGRSLLFRLGGFFCTAGKPFVHPCRSPSGVQFSGLFGGDE